MDDRDLDQRAARLALSLSRRSLLKGGLATSAALAAGAVMGGAAGAARRGYSGPEPAAPRTAGNPSFQITGFGSVEMSYDSPPGTVLVANVGTQSWVVKIVEEGGSYSEQAELGAHFSWLFGIPGRGFYEFQLLFPGSSTPIYQTRFLV